MPVITENGAEGLRRAAEAKTAIIILDLMVPGRVNFKLHHSFRQDKKTPEYSDNNAIHTLPEHRLSFSEVSES